jgi:hypothetical protein
MIRDGIVQVVNGDSVAGSLEEADLPGEIRVWADALDTGPVLPGDDDTYREARAQWWDAIDGSQRGLERARETLIEADAGVEAGADAADELVLWYEHDLFDQLALIRLLALIGRRPRKATVSMVSIDRHPDLPEFYGMGQLESHQLAALWPRRTPIARDALEESAAAWVAITAPEPRAVAYVARRIKALPFLGPALERHLEELPDTGTGLTRTERQLLAALARGVDTVGALMRELTTMDPRYTVTDLNVVHALRTLAAIGLVALPAELAGTVVPEQGAILGSITATPAAKDVLAGKVDRVATYGIDTWRGGVRLLGTGPVWRWDQTERRAVLR